MVSFHGDVRLGPQFSLQCLCWKWKNGFPFSGSLSFPLIGAELAFEVLVILYSKDFHEITQNEHFHTQVWTPFEVLNGYQGALLGVCRTGVIQATWACSSVKETHRPHTPTIAEPRWRATSYMPVQSERCLLRPGVLVAEGKIIILPSPVERTKVREVLTVERSWNIRDDGSQPLRW